MEKKVLDALLEGKNIFLSGMGGTGKSYMAMNLYNVLSALGKVVCKTGSTGVAADHIKGSTLHSWAGIQFGDKDAKTYYVTITQRNKKALKHWINTDILIIDEISMIGGQLFNKLNELAQLLKKNTQPFGGLQLLLVGDMCQLPPVRDEYIFDSESWDKLDLTYFELTKPWRYSGVGGDTFFLLNKRARVGKPSNDDIKRLEERKDAYYKEVHNKVFKEGEIEPSRLFSKKVDVDLLNLERLNKLTGDEYKYVCSDNLKKKTKGAAGRIENYQDNMNKQVRPEISLKVGAQVMLTCNLDVEKGLCNGSRAVVLECLDNCVLAKFRTEELMIYPNVWETEDEDHIFTRAQIPLILAWSITIHKSQSATLDSVVVDIGTSIFSPNMAYVALSRCRSLDGLYLSNFIPQKIYCDPQALEFQEFLTANSVAEDLTDPIEEKDDQKE